MHKGQKALLKAPMARFRLTLEYDGGGFQGWQRQREGTITVQGVLETALARLCGHRVTVIGSGRTDSGVHAFAQVAHFDTTQPRDPSIIMRALNATTPVTLTILQADKVDNTFHAQHSARHRHYLYRIMTRCVAPALERQRVWHHPRPLDIGLLKSGASILLGTHDFSAFRAISCQAKNPVRTISHLDVEHRGSEIHIQIGANGFLHHMVRNIVGTLTLVGRGEWPVSAVQRVLDGKDRSKAGPTAPSVGLYLDHIVYEGAMNGG